MYPAHTAALLINLLILGGRKGAALGFSYLFKRRGTLNPGSFVFSLRPAVQPRELVHMSPRNPSEGELERGARAGLRVGRKEGGYGGSREAAGGAPPQAPRCCRPGGSGIAQTWRVRAHGTSSENAPRVPILGSSSSLCCLPPR